MQDKIELWSITIKAGGYIGAGVFALWLGGCFDRTSCTPTVQIDADKVCRKCKTESGECIDTAHSTGKHEQVYWDVVEVPLNILDIRPIWEIPYNEKYSRIVRRCETTTFHFHTKFYKCKSCQRIWHITNEKKGVA